MTAPHRVNQLEVELEAAERGQGLWLLERVVALRQQRIQPVLDRVCGELSGSGRIDRIDTLELDLGAIAVDEFDQAFERELEAALRRELAKKLSGRPVDPDPQRGAHELVESFARTGNLPWWADANDRETVSRAIEILLGGDAARLGSLLGELAGDPAALDRLARYFDAAALAALAERLGGGELIALAAGLPEPARGRHAPAATRAWLRGLATLGGRAQAVSARAERRDESAAVHAFLAASTPSARAHLLERAAAARSASRAPRGAGLPPTPRASGGQDEQASPGAIHDDAGAPSRAGASRGPSRPDKRNNPHGRHYTDGERARDAGPTRTDGPLERGRPRIESTRVPDEREPRRRPPASPPAPHAADNHRQAASDAPATGARTAEAERARRRAFAQLEQLYVVDAGLVILWPFLARFFDRCGLLEPQARFTDHESATRGVLLLSQLTFEDREPPEFRLPLAKLLCGLAPDALVSPAWPLQPEQVEECEILLAAVVEHASVLRQTSNERFRSSFLQRAGVLATHEGTWLLQVERETYDVVLERFPWSWSWVKLPWMSVPLRVEW